MKTLKPFRFYVTEYEGETFAFTEDMLREIQGSVATGVLNDAGADTYRDQPLDEVARALGDGTWCDLTIYRPLHEHQLEADALVLEASTEAGGAAGFRKRPEWMDGARLEVLFQSWTLPAAIPNADPSINGFQKLPAHVATVISEYLGRKMYPSAHNHPGFSQAWNAKREALQAAERIAQLKLMAAAMQQE